MKTLLGTTALAAVLVYGAPAAEAHGLGGPPLTFTPPSWMPPSRPTPTPMPSPRISPPVHFQAALPPLVVQRPSPTVVPYLPNPGQNGVPQPGAMITGLVRPGIGYAGGQVGHGVEAGLTINPPKPLEPGIQPRPDPARPQVTPDSRSYQP